MPPSPQALANPKGINIKVRRPDLDGLSIFPYVQTSLGNLSAPPFSFCLTHETS